MSVFPTDASMLVTKESLEVFFLPYIGMFFGNVSEEWHMLCYRDVLCTVYCTVLCLMYIIVSENSNFRELIRSDQIIG